MAALKERPDLRNRYSVFRDRWEAGLHLADILRQHKGRPEGLVLAIPSGGVPVGLALAGELELPLDVVIARKLQIPGNTEAGFGALALGGGCFLNHELMDRLGIDQEQVEAEMRRVRQELDARNQTLRNSRPLPQLEGRKVILVDDGLASGFTMLAALEAVREKNPAMIIVAVPTAPMDSIRRLSGKAEQIICANIHDRTPFAVANAYQQWRDLETSEVRAMLGL